MAAGQTELSFRAGTTLEDFRQCVELQRIIWNFSDVELLPANLFVVGSKIGGQIFGAFEPSGRMVGFCISIPGIRGAKGYLHSHMLAVLGEFQNQRVGWKLKQMQREDAVARGVSLIEWTFDPLELKNAFFNLERLGVIIRRFVPNQYGISTSALHSGLPTDRLVAEWWVASQRAGALAGHPPEPKSGPRSTPPGAIRIAVPSAIAEIKRRDRAAALALQTRLREQFQEHFRQGFVVTGFQPGNEESAYLLEKSEEPTL